MALIKRDTAVKDRWRNEPRIGEHRAWSWLNVIRRCATDDIVPNAGRHKSDLTEYARSVRGGIVYAKEIYNAVNSIARNRSLKTNTGREAISSGTSSTTTTTTTTCPQTNKRTK